MRRTLRVLRRLFVVLGVLILLIVVGAAGLVYATLPGGDLRADIPGLSGTVTVDLDADGIPWIHASSEADAAAALGFLHARERLFSMDLMRRAASGRLSEIAGRATLGIDRQMRTLGVRRAAEADLAGLPADTRAMLDAYARGVNAWIEKRGRMASSEFLVLGTPEPWTPVDSLLWAKTMGLYLSGNWRVELAREALGRTLPAEAIDALWPADPSPGRPEATPLPTAGAPPVSPPVVQPAHAAARPGDQHAADIAASLLAALPAFPAPFTLPNSASNEWAVDGKHTASGAPLLAGDPHLGFSLPGIWYLARIETPAGVRVGATAPGVPFLVIGHNGRIAWTFTTTGTDTQDIFIETPDGDAQYQTPDGPRPYVVRTERIGVRGAEDDVLTVRETRHGPVISDLVSPSGPVLALSMANLAPGDSAAAGLLALNRATTVAEAGRAAAMITAPNQNLLVADHDGIGVFVTGRVPVRRSGDGGAPVSGADGAHDWVGWAEGDALPHIVNPASGVLVNANDRIAPPDFPVFLARDWYDDWRARRIRDMLAAGARFAPADFAAMQVDDIDMLAHELLPQLLAVPADGAALRARDLLAGWNGAAAIGAPQPLIFNAWMRSFYLALVADQSVPPAGRAAVAPWPDLVRAALRPDGARLCKGDCTTMLARSLALAVEALTTARGDDPEAWRWGDEHQAVFAHPLLRALPLLGELTEARIPTAGDDLTVGRGGLAPNSFESVHGAAYRGVYDLADLDRSLFIVAPGQSGHVASRLARNFLARWRAGETVQIGRKPAVIAAHLTLDPRR